MPYCEVGNEGIRIFYRTYGRGPVKVLLIIGLASTHDAWAPQIVGLTGTDRPNDDISCAADDRVSDLQVDREDEGGVQVCAFDNRGVGQSSVPVEKSEYSTKIMAKDAIALLDHLGWDRAHVFGHSMGAMIACKLAAMVPQRVLSLALLNVTGGGFECFPRFDRQTISIAIRFLRAKTPEERAAVDLDTHYTKEYLEEYVGSNTRREILHKEYVKAISASGMQSSYGFDGQINACWNHSMMELEIESIRSAGFLVSVIHGRHDVIAQIFYAKKLAEKLQPVARMIDLHGGHLVSHERPEEVNQALLDLIRASEKKTSPYEWTNMAKNISESNPLLSRTLADGERNACFKKKPVLERLNQFLWYLLGLFLTAYDCIRKTTSSVKPVKLEASLPCSHGISSDPTLLNLSRESHSASEREQESGCVSKGFWVEQEIHLCKDVTKSSGSR